MDEIRERGFLTPRIEPPTADTEVVSLDGYPVLLYGYVEANIAEPEGGTTGAATAVSR